jgi:hypothetical protein
MNMRRMECRSVRKIEKHVCLLILILESFWERSENFFVSHIHLWLKLTGTSVLFSFVWLLYFYDKFKMCLCGPFLLKSL